MRWLIGSMLSTVVGVLLLASPGSAFGNTHLAFFLIGLGLGSLVRTAVGWVPGGVAPREGSKE